MLQYIKDELLKDVDKLIELLSKFGYCNFSVKPRYITFARNEEGSKKSIVIHREQNDALIVHDFPKNIVCDIFNYVIKEKNETFGNVIRAAKQIVGIDDYYRPEQTYKAFNGFYAAIKNRTKQEVKVYDDSILNKYKPVGNLRFLQDGISLEAQRHFNIGFDVESQSITIPIYDELGRLLGVKCRRNCDDCEQKYWFDVPCLESMTLYGYSHNYQYLEGGTVFVLEAEKSVLQLHTINYHNAVALGSSSISKKQCQMILSLNPEKVVFLLDKDLSEEALLKNMKALRTYGKMKEFIIQYWKPGDDVPSKSSPSDLGAARFAKVLKEELVTYEE